MFGGNTYYVAFIMEVRDLFNLGKCKHIAISGVCTKWVELFGGGSRVNIILADEFCLDAFYTDAREW